MRFLNHFLFVFFGGQWLIGMKFRKLAKELKLSFAAEKGLVRLTGHDSGGSVEITARLDTKQSDWVVTVAREKIEGLHFSILESHLIRQFQISRESRMYFTGDTEFDKKLYVLGPAALVRALLTHEVRQWLLRLAYKREISMQDGAIIFYENYSSIVADWNELKDSIKEAGHVVDVMRLGKKGVLKRLANNAKVDPVVSVRINNLVTLIQKFPQSILTRRTAEEARIDPDPLMRLHGYLALGKRDVSEMIEEIKKLGNQYFSPLEYYSPEATSDMFDALAASGYSGTEPFLFRYLNSASEEIVIDAANKLAEIGTKDAIEPLKQVLESKNQTGLVKDFTKTALAKIRSRLDPQQKGLLTLMSPTESEGQVSLAEEGGDLSLVEDEEES